MWVGKHHSAILGKSLLHKQRLMCRGIFMQELLVCGRPNFQMLKPVSLHNALERFPSRKWRFHCFSKRRKYFKN